MGARYQPLETAVVWELSHGGCIEHESIALSCVPWPC